jgi:xanthine dehydrogenase YagR molybdenum-binding subunit
MRGPGEVTGCYALESALDELAYKLKMDPVELRIKNFTDINPENNLQWSQKNLKECYAAGVEKIGWKNRPSKPGTLKDKEWLIGYGMAGGVFGAGKGNASVRAILKDDGSLVLQCAVSDMGPGTSTSMVLIAAENLQMPKEKIKFVLGDSDLPPGPSQGGSGTTSTVGSAVNLACTTLKQRIKELAIQTIPEFKELKPTDLEVKGDVLVSMKENSGRVMSVRSLLKQANKTSIDLTVESLGGSNAQEKKMTANSFSVHFVKLRVHSKTGEVQLTDVLTCGDAGKIISEKTAKSQMMGGVVGGIGMALKEELTFDHTTGAINNASFGTYHLPLHTDIPHIDVFFTNKPDYYVNEIGSKGVGEISLIGFAAAVTNAVYNATGKRVRDLPITKEKLGFKSA